MKKELAERKKRAYELHAIIGQAAKKTIEAILEIGVALKQMRDEKLFRELGHKDFESYVVDEWNMSQGHAYKYIEMIEKLPQSFFARVRKMAKPLSFRRLLALPNDTGVLEGLSESDLEAMAGMSDEEYEAEMAKLSGYDRKIHGGRGPLDLERPRISRDRYRDQQKKIGRLKEKYNTALDEKDELVGEIEKMEKLVEDLKNVSSPDKNKNELIQENKGLLLRLAELQKLVRADETLNYVGELGMKHVVTSVSDCAIIFNKLGRIELSSHEQWVEFRAYTDTIRHLLELCEERVAVTMAEKGLHPKEYEEWHDGSFKYHIDKATENMRKENAEKMQKETEESIKKAKEQRQQRKKNKKNA